MNKKTAAMNHRLVPLLFFLTTLLAGCGAGDRVPPRVALLNELSLTPDLALPLPTNENLLEMRPPDANLDSLDWSLLGLHRLENYRSEKRYFFLGALPDTWAPPGISLFLILADGSEGSDAWLTALNSDGGLLDYLLVYHRDRRDNFRVNGTITLERLTIQLKRGDRTSQEQFVFQPANSRFAVE